MDSNGDNSPAMAGSSGYSSEMDRVISTMHQR